MANTTGAWHIIYKSKTAKTYQYLGSEFNHFNNTLTAQGYEVKHVRFTPEQLKKISNGYCKVVANGKTTRVLKP